MSPGFVRAFLRLFIVQGAWNYERMTGVGLGYAAEPLLEDLKSADPGRHAEASVRSAEYFNSHPYLAGLALGALVRAEYDQVPAAQIGRLRAALASPLGALGDQVFWIGLVPALMGAATMGVVAGHAVAALVIVFLTYNAIRVATGIWALRTGLANGARIGMALGESWLPRAAPIVGIAAALLVGAAVPLPADWLLRIHSLRGLGVMTGAMLLALLSVWRLGPTVTSVRFGLAAIGLAALAAWGLP
jgi:PTS system mannose-specific IID component